MKYAWLIWSLLLSFTEPLFAQSCNINARVRTSLATVHVCPSGNDAADGMTVGTALKTMQRAVDCINNNVDWVSTPSDWPVWTGQPDENWQRFGFGPVRRGPVVQLCPAMSTAPHLHDTPLWCDHAQAPITVQGDVNNQEAYHVYFKNGGQGFTAQAGCRLTVQGLHASGDKNITLINGLDMGRITVSNVSFSRGTYQSSRPADKQGWVGAIGAANGSRVVQAGPITLSSVGPAIAGYDFFNLFLALENSSIVVGGGVINLGTSRIGTFYVASQYGVLTAEGMGRPEFTGGFATPVGACFSLSMGGAIAFDHGGTPCSPPDSYAQGATYKMDYNSAERVMGFDGAWR